MASGNDNRPTRFGYADSYQADLAEWLEMKELTPLLMPELEVEPEPAWHSFNQPSEPSEPKSAEAGSKTVFEAWRTYGDVGDRAKAAPVPIS